MTEENIQKVPEQPQETQSKPNVFDKIVEEEKTNSTQSTTSNTQEGTPVETPTKTEEAPVITSKRFTKEDANKTTRAEIEKQKQEAGVKKVLEKEAYSGKKFRIVECEFGPLYFNEFGTGNPIPPTRSRDGNSEYRTLRLEVKFVDNEVKELVEGTEIIKETYPNVFVFKNRDTGEWDNLSIKDYDTKDIEALEKDQFTSTVGLIKAKCCLKNGKEPKEVSDYDFLEMMKGMVCELELNKGPISKPWDRPRNDIKKFV